MKRILILSNHFITLFSFRKELINTLVQNSNEVYLSLPQSDENQYFINLGCKIIDTNIDRRGVNPFKDIKLIRQYKRIIKEVNPDIIFSYTIKPNIYGAIASNKLHYKQICNITGTGATFLKNNLIAFICRILYKLSVKKSYKVFFQNTGDRDYFVKHKMVRNNYDMLPGSGCNLEENAFSDMPSDETIKFIFIGRVMNLKGIDEYLECAKTIKSKYPNTIFYIAGWNEEEKYKQIVQDYQEKGYVEYIGFRKDIKDWIRQCHCTILPSHGGEGVPNVLLESAATGRVCIGSTISGTKDVIDDNVTGFLFETGDSNSLIDNVEKFLHLSFEEREQMGLAGRKKIEKEFDRQIVIVKYLEELSLL